MDAIDLKEIKRHFEKYSEGIYNEPYLDSKEYCHKYYHKWEDNFKIVIFEDGEVYQLNSDHEIQGIELRCKEDLENRFESFTGEPITGTPETNSPNSPNTKTRLSDLEKGDKIFCIKFKGGIPMILDLDYVGINFDEDDNWINFSTEHDTKPMIIFSGLIEKECMNNHYFLWEQPSSMYFFTLKPERWQQDLQLEVDRLSELKEEYFNKNLKKFKNKIWNLIKDEDVEGLIKDRI